MDIKSFYTTYKWLIQIVTAILIILILFWSGCNYKKKIVDNAFSEGKNSVAEAQINQKVKHDTIYGKELDVKFKSYSDSVVKWNKSTQPKVNALNQENLALKQANKNYEAFINSLPADSVIKLALKLAKDSSKIVVTSVYEFPKLKKELVNCDSINTFTQGKLTGAQGELALCTQSKNQKDTIIRDLGNKLIIDSVHIVLPYKEKITKKNHQILGLSGVSLLLLLLVIHFL